MKIENEGAFTAAFRDGVNLFVGAGFSILAKNQAGHAMPLGFQLADELRSEFDEDKNKDLDLPKLCTVIDASRRQALREYLTSRCKVETYDSRYSDLLSTNIKCIFSTNIDDLIHRVFEGSPDKYLNDLDFSGSSSNVPAAVDYVALHGSIRDTRRPLRFTPLEIATAFETDRDRWASFRERLRRTPTVFLGYALGDAGTLQAVASTVPGRRIEGESWIQIRETEASSGVAAYMTSMGFQLLVAETEEVLEYAKTSLAPSISVRAKSGGSPGRRRGNVPDPHSVPQRPIVDFFLGAAPTWSDIFSGSVVKTNHYRRVREAILVGEPAFIAGIPGCGKTTLLMQIAATLQFDGLKYLEDDLNADRARLLIREIAGARALVLVDDAVNDIEVLSILNQRKNITVVGADRDYRLATATHLLPANHVILRVSDQSADDLQSIWESLPLQIRKDRMEVPDTADGVSPSLIEFVEANVTAATLRERIADAVTKLAVEDREMAELLVLTCYVHGCRTPLSMDTVLGYLGEGFINYFDIRAKVQSIGELLHEYTGDLAIEPQDYFSARSALLSETIVRKVPRRLLRDVLDRLHREVSPVRIASYDIFRRSAFDHSIFNRAFDSQAEALSLYDWLIKRDNNEYIRQQKALFLADRGDYKDAFFEIDTARSRISRHRNWSIENSYYKILFAANLAQWQLPDAEVQMLRALDGLETCFDRDKRKGMHALVYADCAQKYAMRLRTEKALEILSTAGSQLEQVVRESAWLDRPPELLKQVRRQHRTLSRDLVS